MQSAGKRNDLCLCHLHTPTHFCLCLDAALFLCEDCKLTHLQEGSGFHDLYPYEMMRVYQLYGRPGLIQRKSLLQSYRKRLQTLKDAELLQYTAASHCLETIKTHLQSAHLSFLTFLQSESRDFQSKLIHDLSLPALCIPSDPSLFAHLYASVSLQMHDKAINHLAQNWKEVLTSSSPNTLHRSFTHKSRFCQSEELTPRSRNKSPIQLFRRKGKKNIDFSRNAENSASPQTGKIRHKLSRAATFLSTEVPKKSAIRLSKKLNKFHYYFADKFQIFETNREISIKNVHFLARF